MKAIMISDHAKWCALMMNGEKTIEVRKENVGKAVQKLIDEQGYVDIYVYCSKINKKHYHLIESIDTDTGKTEYEIDYYIGSGDYLDYCYEGKVAFKFRCYKVEKMIVDHKGYYAIRVSNQVLLDQECWINKTCLTNVDLLNYLNGNVGYAIHISDLEIFDKPKELSEFRKYTEIPHCYQDTITKEMRKTFNDNTILFFNSLTKAPQSFMFIEVE